MAYNSGPTALEKQNLRDKHQANQQQIQIGEEARSRRDINDATRSYRNQIDNLKNGYKRTTGATLTDQQAIEELMGDRAFQQVAEKYINSNPALMQDLFKGRDGVGDTYERTVGVQYMPGEEGKSGSWVPTLKATEKGFAESLMEYLPFTENKTSEPDDPVTQLSSEDVFNFINGEKGLNAGVDLGASRRYMDSQNAGLGEDVPLMNIDQATSRMQQRRAPGQTDAAALGNLNTFDPNSGRGQQLTRFRVAEEARVATEKALATAKTNTQIAAATAEVARKKAAATAAYNLTLDAQQKTAAQKKSLAEKAQQEQLKIAEESRKQAVAYLDEAVKYGHLDKVMTVGAQVNASGTLAQKIAQPHKEQEAFLNALYKKHDFGNTAWREFHDKGKGFWNTLLGKGQTAGKLDRTSTLKDRLKVIDTLAGQQLVPLDRDGEWAGNGVLMNDLSDAEREYITTELDQSRIRVTGKNGVSRLLNPADTAAVRAREQQLLNKSMNAALEFGSRGGGI